MLTFHDGRAIHGNITCGETLYVTYQQSAAYPQRVIPYSRDAAIVQARSILRQLAPEMLVDPAANDLPAPVVVRFPVQPRLALVPMEGVAT